MWEHCDDRAEVHSRAVRTTRKDRVCHECGRLILAGETYQNIFMVYDRNPGTWFMCQHCMVAAAWLTQNCGGYLVEGVWEDIHDHVKEYRYPQCARMRIGLMRLEVGKNRAWRRLDGTGLMAIPAMPMTIEATGVAD
jgi:hypothetical protein